MGNIGPFGGKITKERDRKSVALRVGPLGGGIGVNHDGIAAEAHLGEALGAGIHIGAHDAALQGKVGHARVGLHLGHGHGEPHIEQVRDDARSLHLVQHQPGRAEEFTGEYLGLDGKRVYQIDQKGLLLGHDRRFFDEGKLPAVGERMHVAYHPSRDRADVIDLASRNTGRDQGLEREGAGRG